MWLHRHRDRQGGLDRRAWGRSALIAAALHVAAAMTIMIGAASPGSDEVAVRIAPIVTATIASAEGVPMGPTAAARPPAGGTAAATEPDAALVTEMVRSRLLDAERPDAADAMARLAREAAVLERISNPDEVARMSRAITGALNVRDRALSPVDAAPAGSFDFDTGLVTQSTRRQTPRRTEVHETMTDAVGRSITIVTARLRDEATGAIHYEHTLIEPRRRNSFRATEEDFEAAEQRHRPFELMRRFPLVGRLHRQAVLPILDLLATEEGRRRPATTTQPVERRRKDREERSVSWTRPRE